LADDFLPSFVACFGVIVVHPYVIAAERAVIIGVGFPVGNIVKLIEPFAPSRLKNPGQQFVLGGVVVIRFREWHPVVGMVAHANTEAIRLNLAIGGTVFAGMFAGNAPNQAAGGIAWHLVGRNIGCEPMLVVQDASLYAVPFFPVCIAAFPAYMVTNSRSGHQVAFVGGINKDFTFKGFSAKSFYRNDPAVF